MPAAGEEHLCIEYERRSRIQGKINSDTQGGDSLTMYAVEREVVGYRDGWPLLTVETEVNGASKSTNERGPFLVSLFGSSCRYKRLVSCLGCSGQPSTKYFFPHRTLLQFMSLSPSNLGRQSCRAACL
jgi:hypothetical protein